MHAPDDRSELDDISIDREWLKAIGLKMRDGRCQGAQVCGGDTVLWISPDGMAFIGDNRQIRYQHSRGDVVRLCEAIGVELNADAIGG